MVSDEKQIPWSKNSSWGIWFSYVDARTCKGECPSTRNEKFERRRLLTLTNNSAKSVIYLVTARARNRSVVTGSDSKRPHTDLSILLTHNKEQRMNLCSSNGPAGCHYRATP